VALWSVPRSRSTAFLRMMIERGDVAVVHEPFSHVSDFGEAVVAGKVVGSHHAAIAALRRLAADGPVFVKDTTEQRFPAVLADEAFLRSARHAFLLREPRFAIASHRDLDRDVQRDRIGYRWLLELHGRVRRVCGAEPFVFDAEQLVDRPAEVVERFCAHVGLPFLPASLAWAAGEQPLWRRSRAWHLDVSASTGFARRGGLARTDMIDPALEDLYRYNVPFYERLKGFVTLGGSPVGEVPGDAAETAAARPRPGRPSS